MHVRMEGVYSGDGRNLRDVYFGLKMRLGNSADRIIDAFDQYENRVEAALRAQLRAERVNPPAPGNRLQEEIERTANLVRAHLRGIDPQKMQGLGRYSDIRLVADQLAIRDELQKLRVARIVLRGDLDLATLSYRGQVSQEGTGEHFKRFSQWIRSFRKRDIIANVEARIIALEARDISDRITLSRSQREQIAALLASDPVAARARDAITDEVSSLIKAYAHEDSDDEALDVTPAPTAHQELLKPPIRTAKTADEIEMAMVESERIPAEICDTFESAESEHAQDSRSRFRPKELSQQMRSVIEKRACETQFASVRSLEQAIESRPSLFAPGDERNILNLLMWREQQEKLIARNTQMVIELVRGRIDAVNERIFELRRSVEEPEPSRTSKEQVIIEMHKAEGELLQLRRHLDAAEQFKSHVDGEPVVPGFRERFARITSERDGAIGRREAVRQREELRDRIPECHPEFAREEIEIAACERELQLFSLRLESEFMRAMSAKRIEFRNGFGELVKQIGSPEEIQFFENEQRLISASVSLRVEERTLPKVIQSLDEMSSRIAQLDETISSSKIPQGKTIEELEQSINSTASELGIQVRISSGAATSKCDEIQLAKEACESSMLALNEGVQVLVSRRSEILEEISAKDAQLQDFEQQHEQAKRYHDELAERMGVSVDLQSHDQDDHAFWEEMRSLSVVGQQYAYTGLKLMGELLFAQQQWQLLRKDELEPVLAEHSAAIAQIDESLVKHRAELEACQQKRAITSALSPARLEVVREEKSLAGKIKKLEAEKESHLIESDEAQKRFSSRYSQEERHLADRREAYSDYTVTNERSVDQFIMSPDGAPVRLTRTQPLSAAEEEQLTREENRIAEVKRAHRAVSEFARKSRLISENFANVECAIDRFSEMTNQIELERRAKFVNDEASRVEGIKTELTDLRASLADIDESIQQRSAQFDSEAARIVRLESEHVMARQLHADVNAIAHERRVVLPAIQAKGPLTARCIELERKKQGHERTIQSLRGDIDAVRGAMEQFGEARSGILYRVRSVHREVIEDHRQSLVLTPKELSEATTVLDITLSEETARISRQRSVEASAVMHGFQHAVVALLKPEYNLGDLHRRCPDMIRILAWWSIHDTLSKEKATGPGATISPEEALELAHSPQAAFQAYKAKTDQFRNANIAGFDAVILPPQIDEFPPFKYAFDKRTFEPLIEWYQRKMSSLPAVAIQCERQVDAMAPKPALSAQSPALDAQAVVDPDPISQVVVASA
jgi:CII-binding regulator of phage lambda lysogenization HflD